MENLRKSAKEGTAIATALKLLSGHSSPLEQISKSVEDNYENIKRKLRANYLSSQREGYQTKQ